MRQISDEYPCNHYRNEAVDHSNKESQCVEHHTIQLQKTAKVTAWRRRFSYEKSNNI